MKFHKNIYFQVAIKGAINRLRVVVNKQHSNVNRGIFKLLNCSGQKEFRALPVYALSSRILPIASLMPPRIPACSPRNPGRQ